LLRPAAAAGGPPGPAGARRGGGALRSPHLGTRDQAVTSGRGCCSAMRYSSCSPSDRSRRRGIASALLLVVTSASHLEAVGSRGCSDPLANNYQHHHMTVRNHTGSPAVVLDPGIMQADNRGCKYSCAGLLAHYERVFERSLTLEACHVRGRGSPQEGWPVFNGGWPKPNSTIRVPDNRTLVMQGYAELPVSPTGEVEYTVLPARIEAAALYSGAVVVLRHVTLEGLRSPTDTVGNYGDGGAVAMSSGGGGATRACDLSVSHTVFRHNFANDGGGIFIAGSAVTVEYSAFINNSALMGGGAIFVQGVPSPAAGTVLHVLGCVFLDNKAQDMGAAIWIKNMDMSSVFDHWLLAGCRGFGNAIDGPAQTGSCGGAVVSGSPSYSGIPSSAPAPALLPLSALGPLLCRTVTTVGQCVVSQLSRWADIFYNY
jgi:hypothetical protein